MLFLSKFRKRNQLNWLFKSHLVPIRPGISIIVYFLLLICLIFVFYLWNFVPTRTINIRADLLKADNCYRQDSVQGEYSEPYIDLSLKMPMSMQRSLYDHSPGALYYDARYISKTFAKDTTVYDRYLHTFYFKRDSVNSFVKCYGDNLLQYGIFSDSVRNKELYKSVLNDKRIYNTHKKNVVVIDMLQITNEFFWECFHEKDEVRDFTEGSRDSNKTYGILQLKGRRDSFLVRNIYCDDYGRTQGNTIHNSGAIANPGWFNMSDISQAYFNIGFETNTYGNVSFTIDFCSMADISVINPSPDIRTLCSITYYDPKKIAYIKHRGLHFYAKFPEMENKQSVRVFTLTTIMTLLLTAILKDILLICISAIKRNNN